MTTTNLHNTITRILLAAMFLLVAGTSTALASSKPHKLKYTKERPLRIVVDWNFAPFEYNNDKGEPEGYNVDVITAILNDLDVPYVFMLREWKQALHMFDNGEADLMVEPLGNHFSHKDMPAYSRKSLAPYKIKIAYKKGTRPITKLKDMGKNDILAVKTYDYAAMMLQKRNDVSRKNLRYVTSKTALHELSNGYFQYFAWGEWTLERMVKELDLQNIEISDIDIPAGDMRLVSHDKQLIDEMDDLFARMEQSGDIYKLKTKWFHPERQQDDASPMALFIIIIAVFLVVIIVVANRIMSARIKRSTQASVEKNSILQEALNTSGNFVVRLDVADMHIYNVHGTHLPPKGISRSDYHKLIHPDDQDTAAKFADSLIAGVTDYDGYTFRWNAGSAEAPEWHYFHNRSIAEKDKNGKVMNIISTLTDTTDDKTKERQDVELATIYSSIFEMTIVGLALYDSEGHLINANKKMREMLKYNGTEDGFYKNKRLSDFTSMQDFSDFDNLDETHFCTRVNIPERSVSKFVEIRLRPIKDEEGHIVYTLVALRDIDVERDIYLQRKLNNDKLKAVQQKTEKTEDELRYLLRESDMRVWRSSFDGNHITFYKDLRTPELQINIDDMVDATYSEEDKTRMREFVCPSEKTVMPDTQVFAIRNIFDGNDKKMWFSINRIPDYDKDGKVAGCFGLIRNKTELMEAQEKLRLETQFANDSERQKSMFLANMSHEIRTPLNAIVGFCDLLQSIESQEDRKEFIRIIRNNCNMLLHLINDILIVSSMDSDGLAIEPHVTDFAAAFDDLCVTFEQQAADTDVQFIKENPYRSLLADIDNDRIQQVIINFFTNALKHTSKGHIRVGYEVKDGGLHIYCEDTGHGIPKEKCLDVFRRFVKLNDFVQGTGLGLSICKAIADSCGGRIGVDSDTGQGATFWIWIPCEITSVETK